MVAADKDTDLVEDFIIHCVVVREGPINNEIAKIEQSHEGDALELDEWVILAEHQYIGIDQSPPYKEKVEYHVQETRHLQPFI